MGRMFRILSDKADPVPGLRPQSTPAAETPYVEIGGPEGLISSIASPVPVAPAAQSLPERWIPASNEPAYLSVQFHRAQSTHGFVSDLAPEIVAHYLPDHPVSAEYRQLRDEIRDQLREIGPKAILLSAARSESGTTTVLLNLAVTLAREVNETKVAIVDADFDKPAIAGRMAVSDQHGLTDVLNQNVPLAWAMQPTTVPRLQVLAAGHSELKPAAATDLPRLIAQLKQWFDWVLIDGGVWGQRSDRDAVAGSLEAVYAVTRAGDLERTEFTGLRDRVAHVGGTLRGYITTKI